MYKLVVLLSIAALAAAKPSAVLAPVTTYSTVVPAQSSVSQYSSSVVHGSPTVVGPAVYTVPQAYYSAPAVYRSAVVPAVTLTQPPHSPAVVLDAVNGVPLDTPEVVAARAAHYQAKALSGLHHVGKRSVGVAPLTYSSVISPLGYPSTLAYSTPVLSPVVPGYASVYPRALSVHPY